MVRGDGTVGGAVMTTHVTNPTTPAPLALGSNWRGQCPCGWVGPERRTFVVADADCRLHALEQAYEHEKAS